MRDRKRKVRPVTNDSGGGVETGRGTVGEAMMQALREPTDSGDGVTDGGPNQDYDASVDPLADGGPEIVFAHHRADTLDGAGVPNGAAPADPVFRFFVLVDSSGDARSFADLHAVAAQRYLDARDAVIVANAELEAKGDEFVPAFGEAVMALRVAAAGLLALGMQLPERADVRFVDGNLEWRPVLETFV